jgi:DNA-binding NarL/FixJ family response regulator
MSIIKIIVADNQPVIVSGIREFLKSAENIRIVGTCFDGVQALQLIRELRPVIAIVGVSLPKNSGFEVLATVNVENLHTRILFFSASASPRDIITAMAEGAYGFLRTDSQPYEFLRCIQEIAAGRKCLPVELLGHVSRSKSPAAPLPIDSLLTPREWRVMELAAKGLSNKEIGRRLNVSAGTAKIHLYHIFKKVGVKSRSALASLAFRPSSTDKENQNADGFDYATS